ncbi:MAG: N-succinylarginine dihydrolase, partial [Erythrobacter sp.]
DVVAVANESVLFAHELAFADRQGAYDAMRKAFPSLQVVEVPDSAVSLAEAIKTYLFNAQLLTLPDPGSLSGAGGGMALIVPEECHESPAVWRWCEAMMAGNGPIRQVIPVDVRQSMANGGGPACLRLRVVCDPSTVDPRFLLSEARADLLESVISAHWPEQIDPADIGKESLAASVRMARMRLLEALDLHELG